jgi:RNA polymerase sigma-70 factor (ECF subfamily)
MSTLPRSDRFVEMVVEHQRRLYAYILTLVPDPDLAWDVLQQTNLVLWRDAERFDEDSNFFAWACRIAYFQVLSHREKVRRDRLRFGEELIDQLGREIQGDVAGADRMAAMQKCVEQLAGDQHDLLRRRYQLNESAAAIANSTGRTTSAVANRLYRIRTALMDCIQRRLTGGIES